MHILSLQTICWLAAVTWLVHLFLSPLQNPLSQDADSNVTFEPGRRVQRHLEPGRRVQRHLEPGRRVQRHLEPGRRVQRHLEPGRRVQNVTFSQDAESNVTL